MVNARKRCVVHVLYALLTLGAGLSLPVDVAWGQQDLFVSSRNTNSVKRYDGTTGAYLGDFVAPGAGGLIAPQEVVFGLDGHLLVSGRGNTQILQYDARTGAFMGPFTSGYDLSGPTKMTVGPDSLLLVSQWGPEGTQQPGTLARFDAVTGVFVDEFPSAAFSAPSDHAWDADGTLYVVSFGSADVRRFDPQGNELGVFVERPSLQGPVNLWFDEAGNLNVLDWQTGSVEHFDGQTGASIGTFISGMIRSEGFTVGPDRTLYIGDWQRNQINTYDAQTGAFLGTFARGGGLLQPNSMIFGPPRAPTGIDEE